MSITHLTFIDVETVPESELPNDRETLALFLKRFEKTLKENEILTGQQLWNDRASLNAEFGKIIAISIGKMVIENVVVSADAISDEKNAKQVVEKFYIRSLMGRDEGTLLKQASESFARAGGTLVGHNAIEFDFPFLMRRYMVHGLPIPPQLNVAGTKPWDVKLEDTMKMWSGTQWNYKVSLELLCHVLGIPSPKQDISGADVAQIYWDSFKPKEGMLPFDVEHEAMKKIGDYCAGDVLACANAYCRMKGLPLIENVEYV